MALKAKDIEDLVTATIEDLKRHQDKMVREKFGLGESSDSPAQSNRSFDKKQICDQCHGFGCYTCGGKGVW